MRVRWSQAAAADLQSIHQYLTINYPLLTASTIRKIYDAALARTITLVLD